ncbi:MAG: zinc ribbon domain-containing protein [Holophagales bacterium]|nr:zinc ribbon domain-containing protein [Holophagales bacterium]
MSLEQLLTTPPSSKEIENKPVSPTLLLGLGGTGKEILLRFRRRVVERYGSLSALPFLQYVHLDTDTTANAKEQYDLPSSGDPLYEALKFRPSERIDLTIEGGTGKYVNNIRTYPHIGRWFPSTGKIAALGNLGEGAGQVRIASRLGFYHAPNFQKITSSLDHARRNLSDPKIANRVGDLGFDFDANSMDVFVACSIAGGTGGGTYLDLGFLLKRFFGNANTVGILLLPSFFAGYAGGTRVQANGYASLMELNHHAFGHPFLANWDGTRSEDLPPPPFDVTYLIDGTNESGLSIPSNGGEHDAYQMIAEVLFHDYSLGSFAGKKRATRINLVNFSLDVYSHNFLNEALRTSGAGDERNVVGDTFPTRFGSFGFSSISFPTDRVHSACGARLAVEILELWGSTLLEDPLERLFTRFLSHSDVQFGQGRFERRDGGGVVERTDIEDALLVYEEGGGKTFQSYLWEKSQRIRNRLQATPVPEKSVALAGELAELDRLFSHEDSEDKEEWGLGIRQLESNKRDYLARVKAGLEKRARETADDPKYGVAYTLSLLRELKLLLRNELFTYLPHFDAEIETWRDEIEYQRNALDQLTLDISRHEGERLFRGHHLRWDLNQLVGETESDPPGALYSYYYSRVRKQVAKRAKAICEAVNGFLGKDDVTGDGLLGAYWKLLSGFGELQRRLQEKVDYFRAPQSSELVVSLYRQEDCDTWYTRWTGEAANHRETLEAVGNRLLQEVFEVDSVTAAMAQIQRVPPEELEARILEECKSFFANREAQPEALELLMDKRWDGQRERMVKRAYDLAKVWLKRSASGLDHIHMRPVVPDQRPCLIGLDTENSLRFPELERIVREIRSASDSPASFQNIGKVNRGVILFYNELAGVPAFYPEAITRPGGLYSAYLRWDEKDDLHFDKNRYQFGDLIPKTDEEARKYAESVRAFVLARVLGLLEVRNLSDGGSDQLTSYYSYSRGGLLDAEEISLGTEAQAIDALYRDARDEHRTDRRHLLEAVEETIQHLHASGLLWVYWLLLEFYMYLVYPPNRDEKWVSNLTVVRYSPEYAVLANARAQISGLFASDEERRKLETALDTRRRGKKGEEMSYEEYLEPLREQVVLAGKVEVRSLSLVLDKRTYLDTPVLDRKKLLGARREYPEPAAESRPTPRSAPHRPCPNCGEEIDVRARRCRHCKNHVAEIRPCPTCGAKVPSDFEECWSCGEKLRRGEKMECPECHAFQGYIDEFPCPECSYDPDAPPIEVPASSAMGGNGSLPAAETPTAPEKSASKAGPEPTSEARTATAEPEAEAETGEALVECPTCYSLVEAGPKCAVCDGLL